MTIDEAVMNRHSARTFRAEPLSESDSTEINNILRRLPKRHFGKSTVCVRRIDCPEGVQVPGTYGCISGAKNYVVFFTPGSINAATCIDCGMIAELMALYATKAGFGTCLMTGSIRDSQFADAAGLDGGDSLMLASPVGYSANPRLAERIIKKMAHSNSRMPLSRIAFTDSTMSIPWQADHDDQTFTNALIGLRQAPSAFNKQPWRVVVQANNIEIHNSETDMQSWIGIGAAVTNYCAMMGIRSDSLELAGTPEKPVVIAPRPI